MTGGIVLGDSEDYVIIAEIENQFEAAFLEAELKAAHIPYYIQSYFDAAYGNVFQLGKGWGRLLSKPQYQESIAEILQAVRKTVTSD